jgi:hypothetical protein
MAVERDNETASAYSAANPLTFTHVCSGSNRLLIVSVSGNGVSAVSGITYGGVAMTYVGQGKYDAANVYVFTYILINPAVGSNTVSISLSNGGGTALAIATSYKGCKQSAQPSAATSKNQSRSSSESVSLSVATAGSWAYVSTQGSNNAVSSGVGVITRVYDPGGEVAKIGDSNGVIPTGSQTMGLNGSCMTGLVALVIDSDGLPLWNPGAAALFALI